MRIWDWSSDVCSSDLMLDRGNLAIGIEREEGRIMAFVRHNVDAVRLVRQTGFLEHDSRLHAVRRRRGEELNPVGILRGPARKDRMIEAHAPCSRFAC